jgi:peptidoglycan L-alanyl-D-glutamate endopeptidase CwlK
VIYHREKLENVHPDLVRLFTEYGKDHDIIIVDGHRDKASQDLAYLKGNSNARWGQSPHNKLPSRAVDAAPSKDNGKSIDWRDSDAFRKQAEDILFLAKKLGINILWGGSFKRLVDLPHFELI